MKKRSIIRLLLRLNFIIRESDYYYINASKSYKNNLVFLLSIDMEKQKYKVYLDDEKPEENKIHCTDWEPVGKESDLKNSIKEWETIFKRFKS